jgi:hypothetical protein
MVFQKIFYFIRYYYSITIVNKGKYNSCGFSNGTKSSKTAQKFFSKNRQDVFGTSYQP